MVAFSQANGQPGATNKIIEIFKKNVEDKRRRLHGTLNEVLQAMRNSKSTATEVSPYRLVYGAKMLCCRSKLVLHC